MKIVQQTASFSEDDFKEEYDVAFVEGGLKGITQKSLIVLENGKNDPVVLRFRFDGENPQTQETLSLLKGIFSQSKKQQNIFNFEILCERNSSIWAHKYSPKQVARILSEPNDAIGFVLDEKDTLYLCPRDFRNHFPLLLKKLFFAGCFTSQDFFHFSFQISYIHAPEVHKMMADIYGQMDGFYKNINRDAMRQAELTPSP